YPIIGINTQAKNQEPVFPLPASNTNTEKIKAELNFSGASIAEATAVFSALLNFNYAIDGNPAAKITMSLNQHCSSEELLDIFSELMRISGCYIDKKDGFYAIRPLENLRLSSIKKLDADNIGIRCFYLKNITCSEIAPALSAFVPKGNEIIQFPKFNMVMLCDTPENITRIALLIDEIDQSVSGKRFKMLISCRNINADLLANELAAILPVMGFPAEVNPDKPQADSIQLQSLERLQLLLVASANREALDEVAKWMKILDAEDIETQEKVFIYEVINSKADELVKALSVLFPVSGTALKTQKESSDSTEESISGRGKSSPPSPNGDSANKKTSTGNKISNNVFDTTLNIFADSVHNRLLIKTTPRAYAMARAVLQKLDTVPTQVLLQILVVEVSLNDSVKFGVEFMMQDSGKNYTAAGGTNYKNLVPGDKEQYGGKFWLFNPDNPDEKFGYINALAGKTDVKVISSPQVLVISHNQAEIAVGDKVPIVNSEITNTASSITSAGEASTNLVRNIQYQDTGIILKVTPHVTRGDRITIDIDQTVSEAISNKTSNIDSPEIQERKLKTNMSLRNGQTLICGGIIKNKRTENLDSLPMLINIPIIRNLVGDTDYAEQRTEMIILISGTIIREETALSELLTKYRQSVDALIEFEYKNQKE
ncbi:MAG: secretin N-terminal domain-containing protein, partial [Victivallaceae bacterium]